MITRNILPELTEQVAAPANGAPLGKESVGLYVHFPWCARLCTYCDFDRQAHAFNLVPRYVDALCREIAELPRVRVHSIYFGGGTPSLMAAEQVRAVLDAARARLELLVGAEVTLETNPDDTIRMALGALRDAGVNRISMGVQSLDDRWLRLLGRRHSAADARAAVQRVKSGGVDHLSLDLMFGLPGLTVASWRDTLEQTIALAPEHVSSYLLTVDERVPLGRDVAAGRLALPDDDELAAQYELTMALLGAAGYEHYEISNWARPGRASRHNLTYWRDEPYLGVGAGAASSWAGRRYKNTPLVARYLAAIEGGTRELQEDERPDPLTAIGDHFALGLRLREGLDLDRFAARFGAGVEALVGEEVAGMLAAGVLERHGNRMRVAERHVLVTNEVLARLQAALAASPGRSETSSTRSASASSPPARRAHA
jgi:oxygen-independent coproporphyrinogen-3 oxidase